MGFDYLFLLKITLDLIQKLRVQTTAIFYKIVKSYLTFEIL